MGLVRWVNEAREDRKFKRLLRDTPPCSLAEVRENQFVHVVGRVETHGARALEAPLSGRLCAYYSITVTARVRGSFLMNRREHVLSVADEDEGIVFELEADGARAIVDPTNAWISSKYDHTEDGTSERARALSERFSLKPIADTWRNVVFQEAILELGERIALYGAGTYELDDASHAEQGFREAGALRVRFSGSARFPLVIRDDLASA